MDDAGQPSFTETQRSATRTCLNFADDRVMNWTRFFGYAFAITVAALLILSSCHEAAVEFGKAPR